MIKRTLLAVAISATLFSLEVSANNNARANGAISAPTAEASVGHRPVQDNRDSTTAAQVEVTGELTTGATLTLNNVVFTDKERDALDLDKMLASKDKIKWYLVSSDAEVPSGAPAGQGKEFIIPADAAGKKIKVVYRIMTVDGSLPDAAFLPSTVLLNTATSGVTAPGGGNTDGTISAKLAGVTIKVNGTPTDELNGTTTAGTPIVGSTMVAELTCAVASDCADPETKYNFQWQMADATTPDVFTDLTDADATSMTYTVKGTQQNKLFQVVVTPKTTKADAPASKAKRR